MDDFSITDDRLKRALRDIRWVNRLLGGYAATRAILRPVMQDRRALRMLDLGTGGADAPEYLVQWAARRGVRLEVVAVDANAVTVDYARAELDRRLPKQLRAQIRVEVGDALALPFEANTFDVVHAALFMHHLPFDKAARLLREMECMAQIGLIVNDLHRHPLAYYSIKTLGVLLPTSEMFRHDAPLSVLRSFRRRELRKLARQAGLADYRVRWHWAFRWTLSTVSGSAF